MECIMKTLNKTRMHSSRMRTVCSSCRISGGGWCLLRGVSALGVCLLQGGWVSTPGLSALGGACSQGSAPGGVSAPRGCAWGVSALGVSAVGVSSPRVCVLWGGVCSWGVSAPGVSAPRGVSHYALRQTPPPPCGQTDACKNITFTTLLRTVIIYLNHFLFWQPQQHYQEEMKEQC